MPMTTRNQAASRAALAEVDLNAAASSETPHNNVANAPVIPQESSAPSADIQENFIRPTEIIQEHFSAPRTEPSRQNSAVSLGAAASLTVAPEPVTNPTETVAPEPVTNPTETVAPEPVTTTNNDSVPPPVTLQQMVSSIQQAQDTEGVAFARTTAHVSQGYINQRRRIINDFINSLWACTPKYDTYLKKTRDTPAHFPAGEHEVLFVVLCGTTDKRMKVYSLNSMLVDWIASLKKKSPGRTGSEYHSPSTINYMVRSFFAATKEYYDWNFSYADFNYEGGFNGFFKDLCEKRRKADVSFNVCFCIRQYNFSVAHPIRLACVFLHSRPME